MMMSKMQTVGQVGWRKQALQIPAIAVAQC